MTYQEEKDKILRSISDDRISSATLAEASLLLDELVKTMVIGEDGIKTPDGGHDCYDKFCDYCDKSIEDDLRASQRQVLEEGKK